ncbi:MAG: adenosylcobinamide-GDP ribazoletransferase [Butyrivibrio sp.]|nr:adenosylcobinamide-GDP ribazoletransferase [Acetatifactor muris]MCM1558840.1 adenosylcobinamide-GDP ribazoletransferase [Butyrivibrio sp.]
MRSLIIAFSMYSRIPMPRCEWNEQGMKYSMCFFPLVGAVLGLCSLGVYFGLGALGFGKAASGLVLAVVPILVTGGIHMDGYLDTVDAKSSWKSREEKLRILKDPHMGAFACIYGIVYFFLTAAFFSEAGNGEIFSIAAGYVFSRILSAISVVTFKKAKKEGMAAASADASSRGVRWILALELVSCIIGMTVLCPRYGLTGLAVGAGCFAWYRHMAYKNFGGVTGDLAGYFLQVCELGLLAGIVLVSKI